jgi:sulfonate transport system ATP-binding protein
MQKLIEAIWLRERLTMVLVTHDVEEAVALADRVLVMDEGRVVSEAEINLPRPRARSSLRFVELKEELLERVMGRTGVFCPGGT